jgi:hypothetical protein
MTSQRICRATAFRRPEQQIFLYEQFAQIADRLDGFILARHRLQPMPDFAPRRRPAKPHRLPGASATFVSRRGFGVSLTMMGGVIGKSSILQS